MEKHLYYYSNHAAFLAVTNNPNLHNVVYCDNEAHVHYDYHDYSQDYFTTVARENGTISFNIRFDMGTNMITSISYSTDNGETWTTTTNTDNKTTNLVIDVNVTEGDRVMWKGDAEQLGYWSSDENVDDMVGSFFSSTCEFDTQGNVMSLLYGDNFKGETTIENEYAFACLFSDYDEVKTCKVVNAKNLSLPATTLTSGCYKFMFYGCTNLTTAPELLATTLANECYYDMFRGCTSLTTAPELPATTLADACYSSMFKGCTNLTTAPELPATTLAQSCYNAMFYGCSSLNSITCLATNISATDCTRNWVSSVASTGTFTKAASMISWTTGVSGIPEGWTVQIASN